MTGPDRPVEGHSAEVDAHTHTRTPTHTREPPPSLPCVQVERQETRELASLPTLGLSANGVTTGDTLETSLFSFCILTFSSSLAPIDPFPPCTVHGFRREPDSSRTFVRSHSRVVYLAHFSGVIPPTRPSTAAGR